MIEGPHRQRFEAIARQLGDREVQAWLKRLGKETLPVYGLDPVRQLIQSLAIGLPHDLRGQVESGFGVYTFTRKADSARFTWPDRAMRFPEAYFNPVDPPDSYGDYSGYRLLRAEYYMDVLAAFLEAYAGAKQAAGERPGDSPPG